MVMQIKVEYEPYLSALLQRGHLWGIEFAEGWVFGKVKVYEDAPSIFDRYDSLAAASGNATIAGGSAAYFQEWQDANNKRLFWDKRDGFVMQTFIGISPVSLRWWKQFPPPLTRGRMDEISIQDTLTRTSIGFVNGKRSPLSMPTTLTEMLIPPEFIPEFGIFNPEAFAVNPLFSIERRITDNQILDPESANDRALIRAIKDGKTAKLWSPGISPITNYSIEKHFNVKPIKWEEI